jgi:hypothetical protein
MPVGNSEYTVDPRTNVLTGESGWSDNADCPVLPNDVCVENVV